MCGIAGAVRASGDDGGAVVTAMTDRMYARGPDGGGVLHLNESPPVWFGARRLAIIDPSSDGDQPMTDPVRGTTIAFNGMIYNFRDVRAQLGAEGERFDSDCDTEVVLKAYGRWGTGCVRRLRGMFAFAIWDPRDGTVFLARDRLGIKPLYYVHDGGDLLFASQVKALVASGAVAPRLSAQGIRSFLAYGAVRDPLTAIEDVRAVPAAHVAVFRDEALELTRYWEPPAATGRAPARAQAAAELRRLLEDVVRSHLVSDAPLGVFLSGGVDSSVLAALAARAHRGVRTVSVVFDDPALSEERYVDVVVRKIRSDHLPVHLAPDDVVDWLDGAFAAMDQPTFDGINSFVVSRAAAGTGLKVALSGLGGDELFDGYGHVRRVRALELARRLPRPLARGAAAVAAAAPGSRGAKASHWLGAATEPGASYDLLRRLFLAEEVPSLAGGAQNGSTPRPALVERGRDLHNAVSVLDLTNYTRDVLLRDTDAMSMANSLEVRVPFLDHVLVEWVLGLAAATKGRGKSLLVEAVRDLLPDETASRAKQGFVLPLQRWMRGGLADEVRSRLTVLPEPLGGFLDGRHVAGVWEEFAAGGNRWLRPWALYALARWVESLDPAPAAHRA